MNAAGAGPPGLVAALSQPALPQIPGPAVELPRPEGTSPVPADRVESLVAAVTHPAVQAVLHRLPAVAEAHEIPRSLHEVREVLKRQPELVERVLQEPALAPIRDGVREVVNHLSHEARLDAEKTLAIAAPLPSLHRMPAETPAVLTLANQFLETGQYLNYVRAGDLGRVVIRWAGDPDGPEDHAEQNVAAAVRRGAAVWRRAPLLVLLVAWMLLGVVLNTEIWVAGWLGLVVLQFVVTIRNWRRR